MPAPNPLDAWTAAKLGCRAASFSRTELRDYQTMRLRETITWAKQRSPFYQRLLEDFDESALISLDDLQQLPFTTDEDIRLNAPPLLCLSQSEISHVVTLNTSGTSGQPKRLFFTANELEATTDFFHHGMCLLAHPGDRVLILFPNERPGSVGDLLAKALRRLGATPIMAGWPQDPAATAALLRREQPDVVAGTPVSMLAVARHSVATGLPPIRIQRVLLSADHAAASVRRGLTALWGCEIFEHYGMTEMGLGGGVDCTAHAGYHMRESDLLIEVVNPSTGTTVADGEIGEVVFTTLTRRGMPLIRYRTGDLSRLLPGTCACGSPLASLERLHRRVRGGIRLDGAGELSMAMLDECLLNMDGIADFNATYRHGTPDVLELEITAVSGHAIDAARLQAAARAALENMTPVASARSTQSLSLQVTVSPSRNIPRRSGKRILVEDASL
ncbi:DVU_1553 family AMP-dependent CoA ligase [Rhodoferax sp.]|uniref:DVU_1553 family AMP-dependent CoA ligase n=1 Tax=Rhodoferax sp. TaxID=50421 RepID=UPI0028471882|nr:AMP-binding protein [Rhodoferax sp.]MDR3370929.1 AMP-binding protein [Rhodoferax sp.]